MRRGHLPGHEPLGVLRVPLLLAPLPGHERGWLARRCIRRHRRWGFHRGRRSIRRRGRSATGVVHAGHASRSSRCVAPHVQRLIAGVACPRTRAFPTDCAPPVWTERVGPSWMNEFSNAVRSAGDARARAGRGAGERTDAGFGPTKESTRRTRCARGVLDARPALKRRRTLTRPAGTFFVLGPTTCALSRREVVRAEVIASCDWSNAFVTGPRGNLWING